MTNIAFLGLGAMGSRMALSLLKAGHDVTVWNRDAAKAASLVTQGAKLADSPKAAATEADIVISMVRDDEASSFVWTDKTNGAMHGMRENAVAIECSTLTVNQVNVLAQQAHSLGLRFIDAPLAGSRPQADAQQLIFFAGGEAQTVAEVEPVLLAMGAAVHHAGQTGAGSAIKLAVNALFGIQVAAMAELLGALEKSNVDITKAIYIISATPVASPAAKGAAASMLAKNFAPMFPIELVEKDFGYVTALAHAANGRTPMSNAAHVVISEAIRQGFGGDNITGLAKFYF